MGHSKFEGTYLAKEECLMPNHSPRHPVGRVPTDIATPT